MAWGSAADKEAGRDSRDEGQGGEGLAVGGKTLREHLEVVDQA